MPDYFIGLDLGQTRDYSALSILERDGRYYYLRHLERIPLNTSYMVVMDRTRELSGMTMAHGPNTLIMDATGVGLAVFDELRSRNLEPVGVTLTGGGAISHSNGLVRVPKRDVVVTMVTLFESGRLRVASEIPIASEFIAELLAFKVRINPRSRRERYEAGKASLHDDLVLAVGLACWYGEKGEL